MRFSRLVASAALVAAMVGLNALVRADTQVALSGMVTAQVFPYGQPQIFQVLGDTHGKKCNFAFSVSLNGAPVGIQGNAAANHPVSAALPWNSPDLRLPTSNGGNYSVLVQAVNSASNACTGQFTLSFGVVPQIGTLSKIGGSAKVVAANMPISFTVSGQTFGTCNYTFGLSRNGKDLGHGPVNQLPYNASVTYADAGNYLATADEIDLNGAPDGCTGHVKFAFSVIPRPVCPSASEYYQSPDDSEFGCLHVGVWFSPAAYDCPSGYSAFNSVGQNTQWGCRQPSKPLLGLNTVNGLVGNAANSNLGSPHATAAPQTATPKIVKIETVPPSTGAWRPNSDVLYAGEHYWAKITGNVPNNGGYNPQMCEYSVTVQNIASDAVATQAAFTAFNTWDIGVIQAPGDYRVVAEPHQGPSGDWASPCGGVAIIQKITVSPLAAWVTGFQLTGFGHHFYGGTSGSAWSGQWCQNCDSIFSPAHDSAFMEFNPTIKGITSGGRCAYNVTFNGHSFGGNNSMNLGSSLEVVYQNGQPGLPASQPNLYEGYNPYWSQWTDNSNTAQVIVTPGNDLVIPPCHILSGKISKTITFTNNANAAWVTK